MKICIFNFNKLIKFEFIIESYFNLFYILGFWVGFYLRKGFCEYLVGILVYALRLFGLAVFSWITAWALFISFSVMYW